MGPMSDAQQKVRELFDAHFTISEIVERTALEMQTVVRFERPATRQTPFRPTGTHRNPIPKIDRKSSVDR